MANGDGGFLWLIGSILKGVDAGFDGGAYHGVQSQDDRERRTTIGRRNDKNENQQIGIVETRYQHWNDSVRWRNERDLRELNEPDQGRQGWWFW